MEKYDSLMKIGIISLLFLTQHSYAQTSRNDFKEMEGALYSYTITDDSDSLSSKVITELRDDKGLPVWFSRDFFKEVCLTGECIMVRIKIYWTGTATYLGFQTPKNFPLTKTDHSEFSQEDYKRLNKILSDTLSILKELKMEELTVKVIKEKQSDEEVDAITSATQPILSDYVVKDAVYTCYTLWHTVYGETQKEIKSILDKKASIQYLKLIFEHKNLEPQYICWAIDFIKRNPSYHPVFYHEILNLIKSDNINVSSKATRYFTPEYLMDVETQIAIAKLVGVTSSQNKFEIFRNFSAVPKTSNEAILIILEHYKNNKISAGFMKYVCTLIKKENMKDISITNELENLRKNENLYVKGLMEQHLKCL